MTDYHTNGAIVESIVGSGIKERSLQDTGREAYLIGSRIIISIHCLWSHEPLILINRFTGSLLNTLGCPKAICHEDILIETLLGINGQLREILPLIWITDLHIERTQFVKGSLLRGVTHPCLCLDALLQRQLQVLYQCLHSFL